MRNPPQVMITAPNDEHENQRNSQAAQRCTQNGQSNRNRTNTEVRSRVNRLNISRRRCSSRVKSVVRKRLEQLAPTGSDDKESAVTETLLLAAKEGDVENFKEIIQV